MKMPIPRPKKFKVLGGYIPASSMAEDVDLIFNNPLNIYKEYFQKAFGEEISPKKCISAKLDPELGEGYRISVDNSVVLYAANDIGMNYALSTLLQLVEIVDGEIVYPRVEIFDHPDSEWRGFMQDLARCYHEPEYLYAIADLCWLCKINRLQLHLTDDQGVRFPFSKLPKATSEQHYTKKELSDFVDYCFKHGIIVVPELDAPGHSRAFNTAYPEIFGPPPVKTDMQTTVQDHMISGIMQAEEKVFSTLKEMFSEVVEVFSNSPYIHIGGDEADIKKWDEFAPSVEYRKSKGLQNVHELYGHYVAEVCKIVLDLNKTPVLWEGFSEECNQMIPKEALVFAWESYYQLAPQLIKGGFKIINASWKPLYVVTPTFKWDPEVILDWEKNVWTHWWEESPASVSPISVDKDAPVLGGQLCSWGDRIHPDVAYAPRADMIKEEFYNIVLRLPALAEKTWTSNNSPDKEEFKKDYEFFKLCLEDIIKGFKKSILSSMKGCLYNGKL